MKTRILLALIAVALASAFVPAARAQTWPSKPVRWIVAFPPGGPADVIARVVAQKLSERVAQPWIVDNRAGAGGNLGHEAAAKAAPDGHTVLFVVPSVVTNVFFYKASVDPFRELAPVIQLDDAPMVLLASPSVPAKSVSEVIALARSKPGAVSCAVTAAIGQIGCEMLRSFANADVIMVPYKGIAPAMSALFSGEVSLMLDVGITATGPVKAGRARALASTRPKRSSGLFSELPLANETIPELELVTWHGVMVPRATPANIVQRLNQELNLVLQQPDIRQRMADSGLEPTGGTPEAFSDVMRRDHTRYGPILIKAGVKAE